MKNHYRDSPSNLQISYSAIQCCRNRFSYNEYKQDDESTFRYVIRDSFLVTRFYFMMKAMIHWRTEHVYIVTTAILTWKQNSLKPSWKTTAKGLENFHHRLNNFCRFFMLLFKKNSTLSMLRRTSGLKFSTLMDIYLGCKQLINGNKNETYLMLKYFHLY